MVAKALKKLHDPFPYSRGFLTEMIASFWLCVILAFFFYWVEPFGIQCASTMHLIIFGLVAFVSALINWSLAHFLIVRFINIEKWTVLKDIIRSLFFLFFNALFLIWYAQTLLIDFDFVLAFKFIFYTFLVAIIPLFLRNLRINNMLLKERIREVEQLNQILGKQGSKQGEKEFPITITSDIVNESIATNSEELLYIKAEKNYINVFIKQNNEVRGKLLRISLVKTKKQLVGLPMVQCHRSYLVNFKHVSRISGNSQGLKIILDKNDIKIPVSRTFKKEVISKINHLR